MFSIVDIISNIVENGRRKMKLRRLGQYDIRTATQTAPFGDDANPPNGIRAIYAKTEKKGKDVIVGYVNTSLLAGAGEKRLYSVESDGSISQYIWLKNDGTMEIGGNSDFMMRFGNTKAVVDEIQDDIASLKQAFNSWVTVPNDGGAALKAAAATWAGSPLTENIDDSKIEEIKTS